MKECTLIIPRKRGRYGLALKHKIHADGKVLGGSEEKWNGWGGKREAYDPSISFTAIREFFQEARVLCFPWNLKRVARIDFYWPKEETGEQTVMRCHVYFVDFWIGEIQASNEAGEARFFPPEEIPYDAMMKGDRRFLPRLIAGEKFVANIYFDQKEADGLPKMEVVRNFVRLPFADSVKLLVATLKAKV